ncbi:MULTISPECIES: acireductone dioxygenase [Pseudomonas]|jgi:1,2-dihydroxy-3-keto-5-methylthiopentene dioxygenase|uniref:acireductone dioxygenase n=1 Tax=Pseudomonas TaxID=286 RepID=UPI000487CA3A|nr:MULTISPECIES: acireductone dioxygenase [Pseudomonas]PRA59006.1 acireductone dioxygenase [Pseudomonas sp. MYb115]QXN48890.1 acireductone dioxygenase [Pseudomonas fluorescens]WSO23200.1 acireductone dioxygenase [Pseudomonas fluorescens]
MSSLSVYHISSLDLPNKVLTHGEDITATLAEHGVRFERWPAAAKVQAGASQDEVVGAYQQQIEQLMSERGYDRVEVLSVSGDQPSAPPYEQRHEQDVVRLFVMGRGLFNLHIDDYIYAVLCEKNDLLLLPAGIKHWFDSGERPHFMAIRLFSAADGAVAHVTGDDIASRVPRLDD